MSPAPGDSIAEGYRISGPLEGTAEAWLATGPDGAPVVVTRMADQRPAELPYHPALLASHPIGDGWQARPVADGQLGSEVAGLAVREVFSLGGRLVEALAALHAAGVSHGAVRADRILLRADGRPLLLDPRGEGTPDADVAALARILSGWLGEDASDDDRRLLETAAAGAWTALDLRDALDDARLAGHAAPVAGASARMAVEAPAGPAVDVAGERNRWIGISVATAVLAIAIAWWLLPDSSSGPVAPAPAPVVAEPEPVEAPVPPTEDEIAAMLEQRRVTQAVLDEFINLQLAQEEREVTSWGAEPFEAALALAREAETPFREQDFVAAEALYRQALEGMQAVAALGDQIYADALADGEAALALDDSGVAKTAFELALLIDPESVEGIAGLARAVTLDEAVAVRRARDDAEESGRLEDALKLARQLLALDPAMPGALEAPARIEQAIANRAYRQAMSDGLAALEIQDWGRARARFEAAGRMRPDDPAPREFIAEAERRSREFVLGSHRRKAAEAMGEERWDDAIAHYRALLKREPNARVALDGLARAEDRAALYGELQRFVEQPRGWWSDTGRERARALLSRARSEAETLPGLARLADALARQIAMAEQPVTVTLRSDNACDVVVYRVARLGSFGERQLDLKPGRYTAVATRSGYRDVRKDFLVPAGERPAPIDLICEEPV